MTSLDPSHVPTGQTSRHDRPTRGQAVSYVGGGSKSRKYPIPDLRFEYSYLRSVRRFVHVDESDAQNAASGDKSGNDGLIQGTKSTTEVGFYGVPMRISWGWVFYITMRDQLLSPFAQGAAMAIVTLYMRPFLRGLGRQVRSTWRSIFPPLEPHIQNGAGWMHKQLREFSVGGAKANIALAK